MNTKIRLLFRINILRSAFCSEIHYSQKAIQSVTASTPQRCLRAHCAMHLLSRCTKAQDTRSRGAWKDMLPSTFVVGSGRNSAPCTKQVCLMQSGEQFWREEVGSESLLDFNHSGMQYLVTQPNVVGAAELSRQIQPRIECELKVLTWVAWRLFLNSS